MKIREVFERDIHRSINGVVKADQLDEAAVWQELDEFVVTRELTTHISDLVAVLLETIESEADAADKNGVWVSGFFGSGKSHFIKVLSYLLENREHALGAQRRKAVDFFDSKIEDAMLLGDLKRVVAAPTDTILFNIDVKARHGAGRDALLQVFLKVLNEKQGFSGDHPHIAHMERHLQDTGKLDVFHEAFERSAGESWVSQRDAWEFHRDEVIQALQEALGQSESSVEKWVDSGDESFSLTVENFAKWVKRYLEAQGADHRLMFLVDEVGQFIGNDTSLMLNLQTITEQLGTVCKGRAWVVVTSQEDLDAVLGDLNRAKQHDFSKIQARFKTRLSLSSANVDEVIKARLLRKRESAETPIQAAYAGKHDILRNQLAFVRAGRAFPAYEDLADFATCYPFAAYQFSLVQQVFESIRKAGATGLSLSRGERSTLDAFQNAARQVGDEEIGVLVPFYRFYPAVEGFLDTAVKATIDQAASNSALQPFDITLLKVMFLIRYIEVLPGNVDNLVTLCVDAIDADRLALRRQIEESLDRLERQTLVARNGDVFLFLTNEERAVGREIKSVPIAAGAEERELGKLLFEDLLGDLRKHTYSVTRRDFVFNRVCDDHVVGNKLEGHLEVAFVSPLGDRYSEFLEEGRCILESQMEQGRVLVRLPDDPTLGRELRTYLQTEAYVKTKHTGALPDTTKRILRDRSDDNRERRKRLVTTVRIMLDDAKWFACGEHLDLGRAEPAKVLAEALEYLIQNTYPKMGMIAFQHPNPKQELQTVLRANDVEQAALALESAEGNGAAMNEVREVIRLHTMRHQEIVLADLIDKRFGGRPYGWPELETVLLIARLAVLREVTLLVNQAPLPLAQAYDHLTTAAKQRRVIIVQREVAEGELLRKAQALGKDLFAQQGGAGEEELFRFLQGRLRDWQEALGRFEASARAGRYPGRGEIESGLETLKALVEEGDSLRFLRLFVELREALLDLSDDFNDLQDFYTNQRATWELLCNTVDELAQNRLQIESHEVAGSALRRMEEILIAPQPYALLKEVAGLREKAIEVNTTLLEAARNTAVGAIDAQISAIGAEAKRLGLAGAAKDKALAELLRLRSTAEAATSIAHVAQAQAAAEPAFDQAFAVLEREVNSVANVASGGEDGEVGAVPIVKPRRAISPRELVGSGFLETQEDIDDFLEKLRKALEAAVAANERIQIK